MQTNDKIASLELELEMLKKYKDLQAVHTKAITHLTGTRSYWQSHVYQDGKRKKITAPTESQLIEKLYVFYFQKRTLSTMYDEWVNWRRTCNCSDRTINRNHNDWVKFYQGSAIIDRELSKLTALEISEFFHSLIKQHGLTEKSLNNIRSIMSSMFSYACQKEYLKLNTYKNAIINSPSCMPAPNHSDKSKVYSEQEQLLFQAHLAKKADEHPDNTDFYAIMVLFQLGIRIGELIALC